MATSLTEVRTRRPTKAGKSGTRPGKAAATASGKTKQAAAVKASPAAAPAKKKAAMKPAAPLPARKAPTARKPGTAAKTPEQTAARPAKKSPRAAARRAEPATAKPAAPARQVASPVLGPKARAAARPHQSIDRLHQVSVRAADLDAAVPFYRDILGLEFIARFDPPGLAFFSLGGGVRLLLSADASAATLYFNVGDIDAAMATLSRSGVSFLHKPSLIHRDDQGHFGRKGAEEWMAFFRDPSGNLLALVQRR